jgi:hypothetical protein
VSPTDITAGGANPEWSWAGLCPGNNESAGRHRSGKTRKGNTESSDAFGQIRNQRDKLWIARQCGRRQIVHFVVVIHPQQSSERMSDLLVSQLRRSAR